MKTDEEKQLKSSLFSSSRAGALVDRAVLAE
jgi:hypothetical protein